MVNLYVAMHDVTSDMENSLTTSILTIDNEKFSVHTYEYKIYDLFQIRHGGCPTFNTIDLYILIVSLCFQCEIFYEFCLRKQIIGYLFGPDVEVITTAKNKASVVPANNFLSGKRLLCEAFDVLRKLIPLF